MSCVGFLILALQVHLRFVLGPLDCVVESPEPALALDLVICFEVVLYGALAENFEVLLVFRIHL